MTTTWKYTDASNRVVSRMNADGQMESCLTSVLLADELATVLPADPPSPIPLKVQAQTALDQSDVTMLRCVEAGVPVPADWNTYRKALRAIANGTDTTSTALPIKPAYPSGT